MNYLVLIIVAILGIGLGYYLARLQNGQVSRRARSGGKKSLIEEQQEEKERNKKAILDLLETQGQLTNNHVEQMLDIPESTITRYFDELEKEGKVRQVGKTGHAVFYTLK
jgi:Fic family protein